MNLEVQLPIQKIVIIFIQNINGIVLTHLHIGVAHFCYRRNNKSFIYAGIIENVSEAMFDHNHKRNYYYFKIKQISSLMKNIQPGDMIGE